MGRLAPRQWPLRESKLPVLKTPLLILGLSLLLSGPLVASAGTGSTSYPPDILVLGTQALELAKQGRFGDAAPLWKRLHRWQVDHFGATDPRTLRTLRNLASVYLAAGYPRKAADTFRLHLEQLEALIGSDHIDVAAARLDLAKAVRTLAQFDEAETLTRSALATLRPLSSAPGGTDLLASAHEILGTIAHERGLYPLAEQEHRQVLALRQSLNEPSGIPVANSTANVAQALLRQGRFAQALSLQLQAMELYRRQPGVDTRGQQSTVLTNIGLSHDLLGNRPAALTALREALPMRLQISGPDHPETARLLLNLGALEVADGAIPQGLAHYRQALTALEQRMGPRHISTAFAIQRMAELARELGQSGNARGWYERALVIRRDQLRADHPDIATTLLGLGLSELQEGNPAAADRHLREALSIREKAFGSYHPYTALTRLLLGLLSWNNQRTSEAKTHLQRATEAYTQFLQGEAALLPIQERRRLLATIEESRNLLYGLVLQGAAGRQVALDARLNLQGLLEELERRQTLLLRSRPTAQRDLADLASLTNQLARMELDEQERQRLISQRDQLERQLFRQLESSADQRGWTTSNRIAAALPNDAVLVEFLRYEPVRFQRGRLQGQGESRYAALILQPSGSSNAIDLGPAEPIHRAIWTALSRTQRIDLDTEQAWVDVSELIVRPLLPHIGNRGKWYISPDGELHRVPFSALGTRGSDGLQPFSDQHRIRLITSARELLAGDRIAVSTATPLVVADPDFDADLGSGKEAPKQEGDWRGQELPDQWRSLRWSRLPGSRLEGNAVQKLMGGSLITDGAARSGVIGEAKAPRVLHVASHGAFLPRPRLAVENTKSNRLQALEGKVSSTADPMLRGVVMFAGANRLGGDRQDDGLLSALELSRMDLKGTELVTLSACDTGTGMVEVGDGIYGLRRGIAVAGARSSLLSLWKVNDQATNVLMQQLYGQLSRGDSPEQALRSAQSFMRQHENRSWRNPYFWAAFQLYGKSW